MAERDSGLPESAEAPGAPGREVGATSFLQRAVIRRRVRFLHRRRELALYDLGGFLFESHRLGQPHEEILTEKLEALTALDDELAVLQRALDLHEEVAVLSEPGIAACSHCGTLRDSAANFCPGCGRPAAETVPLATPPPVATAPQGEGIVATSADTAAGFEQAAHLSAGQDSEIAAAAQEPSAAEVGPDATAEMPAVRLLAPQDDDLGTEPAHDPAEPDEFAGEAADAAEGADLTTPVPQDAAQQAGPASPHSHEPAEGPGESEGSDGQAEQTPATAADTPPS